MSITETPMHHTTESPYRQHGKTYIDLPLNAAVKRENDTKSIAISYPDTQIYGFS
jgi:hypothetical protein